MLHSVLLYELSLFIIIYVYISLLKWDNHRDDRSEHKWVDCGGAP